MLVNKELSLVKYANSSIKFQNINPFSSNHHTFLYLYLYTHTYCNYCLILVLNLISLTRAPFFLISPLAFGLENWPPNLLELSIRIIIRVIMYRCFTLWINCIHFSIPSANYFMKKLNLILNCATSWTTKSSII